MTTAWNLSFQESPTSGHTDEWICVREVSAVHTHGPGPRLSSAGFRIRVALVEVRSLPGPCPLNIKYNLESGLPNSLRGLLGRMNQDTLGLFITFQTFHKDTCRHFLKWWRCQKVYFERALARYSDFVPIILFRMNGKYGVSTKSTQT